MSRHFGLRVEVRGGTADASGPSLCVSCRSGHVVRMADTNEEVVRCRQLEGDSRVFGKVASCNKYENAGTPTLDAMRQIAWPVAAKKSGERIGFMPPSEFRKAEKDGKVKEIDEPLVLPDGGLYW